jgi:glycosyltransferase involved in cell wall biosynthesis
MANGKMLCLNMIVKNEMANLERCLGAVAPHIDCWVIGDTGSTDGTQNFIKSFFAARGLPGELHSFPFVNFEQARNAALECAYASPLQYDYLLFCDADMELVVEDPDFRSQLEAPSCQLLQRSGISYWNTRLVRRDAGARYRGVTHEYIDVARENQRLSGAWYKDHASGSNRVDKFERDIRLLSEALKTEPESHRYQFYLAQSLRDAGRVVEAVKAYAKRAEMGGWDEEAWYARLQQARCLRTLKDECGFLREALAAFNQRPHRAEPLYDLARFYREKGMNDASILFAEVGLALPPPSGDTLFVEDFVYNFGFREEFSIAANYARDPERKDRGFAACNWLALNRSAPEGPRELAWSNLHFYIQSAKVVFPSFAAKPIAFSAPEGYHPTNPSVMTRDDEILLVQRTVNFSVTEEGLHYRTPDGGPVNTRNFLLRLTDELEATSTREIVPPVDFPEPSNNHILGFEDMRPFAWRGALWTSSCVRQLTPEAWCEQVLARIDESGSGTCRLADWRALRPDGERLHEKNWMPLVVDDALRFVYLCDPTRVIDDSARTLFEETPSIAGKRFRGGSQALPFDDGRLVLIHEVQWRPAERRRYYLHRFVWFDAGGRLRAVSRPFYFQKKGIEFAAGLAWHPDGQRLIVSYGVADSEAWIATVGARDVRCALEDVERLPFGARLTPIGGEGGTRSAGLDPEAPNEQTARAGLSETHLVVQPHIPDPSPVSGEGSAARASPKRAADPLKSADEVFHDLAPFLRSVDSPAERRDASRALDARLATLLAPNEAAGLPQIQCFYEVMSDSADHRTLVAAMKSMRAAGHPVRLWSYTPQKLDFLAAAGVEMRQAADVVPRGLYDRIVAGSEIRYFSDVFRYAVLYEHGGLWMDTDMILLRSFPYRGCHFLNLQWRGSHEGHFICGNVMGAKPFSRHMRALYEASVERFFAAESWEFGLIGPKLLSDYVASPEGAELQQWLFSPMLFNAIDWMEVDRFDKPVSELAAYLNDDRLFGIHLWTARNPARVEGGGAPLISVLTEPSCLPSLVDLADKFNTEKNRHTGNRHCYARIYDRLLSGRRFSLRRLMEIGLCRGLAEGTQTETPSVALWQTYFPFAKVIGVDLTDFSALNNDRFASFVCDQSKLDGLRAVAAKLEPGSLDVIIDDGSHASFDEQLTLREFFPLLAEGGWYFIESLDWQPPGEDRAKIPLTKTLLGEMKGSHPLSLDPLGMGALADEIDEILFFDSHYELTRARLLGGLVAIRKRTGIKAETGEKPAKERDC